MKYMLLIYGAENAWTESERSDCYVESTQLANDLHQEKKFVAASPLQSVNKAVSVRVRNGKGWSPTDHLRKRMNSWAGTTLSM